MAAALFWGGPGRLRADEIITIDPAVPARPFPHFWEQASDQASGPHQRQIIVTTCAPSNESTDFKYVRFHGIFDDEMGVYDEDAHGRPVYNFSYVDQVYDGLLENGVKPFVELSFMPEKLAKISRPIRSGTSSCPRLPTIRRNGRRSSPPSPTICCSATARPKWRAGISRCGTNRT